MTQRNTLLLCLALVLGAACTPEKQPTASESPTPAPTLTPTLTAKQRPSPQVTPTPEPTAEGAEQEGEGGAASPYTVEALAQVQKYFQPYVVECSQGRFFLKVRDYVHLKGASTETVVEPYFLEGRDLEYMVLPDMLSPAEEYNQLLWQGMGGLRFTAKRQCTLAYANCGRYEMGMAGAGIYSAMTRFRADVRINLEKRVNKPWQFALAFYQGIEPLSCAEVRAHPIWKLPE